MAQDLLQTGMSLPRMWHVFHVLALILKLNQNALLASVSQRVRARCFLSRNDSSVVQMFCSSALCLISFSHSLLGSIGFQTDTSISKASGRAKERTLEVWSTDEPQDESLSLNYKSGENWDQFAANEKKFGVKTDFNENLYTTVLDKSAADFKKKEEQAERLAREIEKGSASNPHVAEERGQKVYDKNADEEAMYVYYPCLQLTLL